MSVTITRLGDVATVTTSSAHGFSDGDAVKISGSSQSEYNGIFQISYVSTTVFTIQVTATTTLVTYAGLSQTSRAWYNMASAPNGDVYAGTSNGDIYKQTAGAGAFVALNQTARYWAGMAAAPNGDVYACDAYLGLGDIYKQTGGSGNFVALSQTARYWDGMAAAPGGDIYASVYTGDIYKQTNGAGAFVALSQTTRNWRGMAAAPNGDVYACVTGGDIYKQTGGSGNFVALSQTTRSWFGMAAAPNGDVYACVYTSGDIYKQTNGAGNFAALNQTARSWFGMAAAPNGDVYACVSSGDIYKEGPHDGSGVLQTAGTTLCPYTETYLKFTKYARCDGRDLFLHESDGHIYEALSTLYQDAGVPVNLLVRTIRIDGGDSKIKTMNRIGIIADKVETTVMMRWSDDDKTTNSTYRIIDLNVKEPMLRKCGAFQRRSIEFRHVGNKPLDITDVEINGGP